MNALSLDGICGGYGHTPVLFDVDLAVEPRQMVALLGRNGVGKTTLMKTVMGYGTDRTGGEIAIAGESVTGRGSYLIATRGVHYVPEHRGIFPNLTVAENIRLAERVARRYGRTPTQTRAELFERFPIVAERLPALGGVLSGGERQILAICRAILAAPTLLLIDELSEGVQARTVAALLACLRRFTDGGGAVLFVEQNSEVAVAHADFVYIMEKGHIVDRGTGLEFQGDMSRLQRRLAL